MNESPRDPLRCDLAMPTLRQWLEQLSRRSPTVTNNEVLEAIHADRERHDEELLAAIDHPQSSISSIVPVNEDRHAGRP